MFVGGEFYYDEKWQVEQPVISTEEMIFLNGGKACLTVISEYLLDHGINSVLLPSYICPTVVDTLEGCGLTCAYYQVRADLSINLDDLENKVARNGVVYFVNYFGLGVAPGILTYLAELKQRGILLIEDNAQAGFQASGIADFAFNSMRKLCPFDGGYLTSPYDMCKLIEKYHGVPNRRLPLIRAYRQGLADYLFRGIGEYDALVAMYEKAEEYYASDNVVTGDPQEKWGIEHLDWEGIRQVRRRNYEYLAGLISGIPGIAQLFAGLQPGAMPLGLPVYINGVPRDWLLDELGNARIGLTVHWDGLLNDQRLNHNPIAVDMAKRILTLNIDQRTNRKHLDYMTETVSSRIQNYSAN